MKFEDPLLSFSPSSHTYTYDGRPMVSVTQLVGRYKGDFDAEGAAKRVAGREGRSVEEVLEGWRKEGEEACELGTAVHEYAEEVSSCLIQGKSFWKEGARNEHEVAVCDFFFENDVSSPAAEVRICHPDHSLAGTVDLICTLDGRRTILDWKTNKRINCFGFGNMKPPVEDLYDSHLFHYGLQLSLYARILRERYEYDAEQLVIVHLDGRGKYNRIEIPEFGEHVDRILREQSC